MLKRRPLATLRPEIATCNNGRKFLIVKSGRCDANAIRCSCARHWIPVGFSNLWRLLQGTQLLKAALNAACFPEPTQRG